MCDRGCGCWRETTAKHNRTNAYHVAHVASVNSVYMSVVATCNQLDTITHYVGCGWQEAARSAKVCLLRMQLCNCWQKQSFTFKRINSLKPELVQLFHKIVSQTVKCSNFGKEYNFKRFSCVQLSGGAFCVAMFASA